MNKILNYFKKNNTKEYTVVSKEAIKIDMPQNLGETKKIKITYGR